MALLLLVPDLLFLNELVYSLFLLDSISFLDI